MSKSRLLLLAAASTVAFASVWLVHVKEADGKMAIDPEHSSSEASKFEKAALGLGQSKFPSAQLALNANLKVTSDFDGDGRSDLMLTNPLNDWYAYWRMSGPAVSSYSPVLQQPPRKLSPGGRRFQRRWSLRGALYRQLLWPSG